VAKIMIAVPDKRWVRGVREECLDQIIVLSAERITGKMDAKCCAEEGEHVISERTANTEGGSIQGRGALCRAWPNTDGIPPGASGAQCQERPDRGTFSSRTTQLVEQTQSWFRMPALQDDELLAKSEVLQHQVLSGTKKAKGSSEPNPEKVEHGDKVITDRILIRDLMSLISQSDGIVARHSSF
jgi:hypothetical protein